VAPTGKLLAEGRAPDSDRVVFTMDEAMLRRSRTAYPLLRDEKLDLVRRELDRIAAARYGTE